MVYPRPPVIPAHRISAINRLPLELLAEIFVHCIPEGFVIPRYRDAPILLCRVCKHWNVVATSTPSLWASISIRYGTDERNYNLRESLIRLWLERSRQGPLDISLALRAEEWAEIETQPLFVAILKLLIREYRRWRTIEITIPKCIPPSLCVFPAGGAPLLESASINITSSHSNFRYPFSYACADIFKGSAQLRALKWQMVNLQMPALIKDLDLSVLRDLYLECSLSPSQCLQILERCPLLQSCYFENINQSSPASELPISLLTLPSLCSLTIQGQTTVDSILDLVTLPSLKSLIVSLTTMRGGIRPLQPSKLPTLISRSSSPLEKLVLDNIPIAEAELIQCLTMLPSLSVLEINDDNQYFPRLTDKIIDALGNISSENRGFICPKLEVVKFTGNVSCTDGKFSDMLMTRWKDAAVTNRVTSLKMVHVDFSDRLHQKDVAVLRELRSQGLISRFFM
ncbi:hypothetical protein BDQ12DRAFT_715603 [Crucibulum laeve]|uniref:F-box domain-containing protein n=1 Tax=Crucibulum laeve TaxID=68775 RepID=A0A5C3LMY0_9AGAR|nr:hypothetical protein BDQ12DRAFT_715603 [Crucibulum laeve]